MTPEKPEAPPVDHLRFHRPHAHLAPTFGNDTFALKAEAFARFFGTPTFLGAQTAIVVLWVVLNMTGITHFDVYPFILLNLAFSLQSAYAAPLILLAQNRQADRDRVQSEEDRSRAASTRADTEYLARELASLRVAVGELATRDFIRGELARLVPEDLSEETAERRKKERKRKREQAREDAGKN